MMLLALKAAQKALKTTLVFFAFLPFFVFGLPGSSIEKRSPLPPPLSPSDATIFLKKAIETPFTGGYCLGFTVQSSNKKSQNLITGLIYGSSKNNIPSWRLVLSNKDQYLLEGAQSPKAWKNSKDHSLPLKTLSEPIIPGFSYTLYDLGQLYLHWPKSTYEGPKMLQGRLTEAFLFHPPQGTSFNTIRVFFDKYFLAALQIEYLSPQQKVLKKIKVLRFKKTDHGWTVKSIQLVDAIENTKSTLIFTHFGCNLDLEDPLYFSPYYLNKIPPVPKSQIQEL